MNKIAYLYIYIYSIAISFLTLPLNLIATEVGNTNIQTALIYGISVFCLVNKLPNRKPRYILLSVALGIMTLFLFTYLLITIQLILGAVAGYLLTKIKSTKYRIIGAIAALILYFLFHFIVKWIIN